VTEGHRRVVDLDLEEFFDRVCHDKLMARIAARVSDQRMLKLIRAFLTAGVMENGLVSAVDEGTPQGGPLSPLMSNLVLDELDRELERRGHRFVRHADDSNVYVRSERAGQRVMRSLTAFIKSTNTIAKEVKRLLGQARSPSLLIADRKTQPFHQATHDPKSCGPVDGTTADHQIISIVDDVRIESLRMAMLVPRSQESPEVEVSEERRELPSYVVSRLAICAPTLGLSDTA
jgi:hypothetical protein